MVIIGGGGGGGGSGGIGRGSTDVYGSGDNDVCPGGGNSGVIDVRAGIPCALTGRISFAHSPTDSVVFFSESLLSLLLLFLNSTPCRLEYLIACHHPARLLGTLLYTYGDGIPSGLGQADGGGSPPVV